MSHSVAGPSEYANQFSDADARIQLSNLEHERDSILWTNDGNKNLALLQDYKNLQNFIDALKARLSSVAANPVLDHPTVEPPPPSRGPAAAILTGIDNGVVNPIKHAIGADVPLPAEAYFMGSDGPDLLGVFWDALLHTPPNPAAILRALYRVTTTVFHWVVWDFKEFVRLLHAWDGSWQMLIGHPDYLVAVIWRGLVTVGIVVGGVAVGPVLESITLWLRWVYDAIVGIVHLGLGAVRGVNHQLQRLHS